MSNFQEARNVEGQKNAKGYQQGVSMTGTIQALVDPQRIFTTNGKPTQRIQLLDALGETCKVKVFLGNGPDIMSTDVGTQQSFTDLAMNRFKNNISYMAFWDSMHAPQGQPTQLTPEKQAIINQARGTAAPPVNGPPAGTPQQAYNPPPQAAPPTQQDYEAKERKKVVGMCFANLLAARLQLTPAVEILQDTGELQAIWQLSNMCIDGMGQVGESSF